MEPQRRSNSGALAFGAILIGIGVLFLISNLRPSFDPWPMVQRYWPVLLVLFGLAMIFDRMRTRNNPQARGLSWVPGVIISALFLAMILSVSTHQSIASGAVEHSSQAVEKQGAQSVTAKIDMPAGELTISGGSARLLDADFSYDEFSGKPRVDYTPSGTTGELKILQREGGGVHFGRTENTWDLRFGDTPLDLNLDMGAGQGNFNFKGMDLSRLTIDVGAGQITVDLTGDRKRDLTANIEGGAGQAIVRLPKDVGVDIRASGGIGSIDTVGLRREGERYVNDALGKSPVTIHMNIEGGVGEIRLIEEQ